ncbi:MAG: YcaO-like family protein [Polyangiaceae bacterium]
MGSPSVRSGGGDRLGACLVARDGGRRLVPAAYCYLGYPTKAESWFCDLDPNGHAAGNCIEEAILQGFFELCERDAVGIWWYSRAHRPGVDLASFEEPYFLALREHYAGLGHELHVLDVTTDLGIPTFVAVARGRSPVRFCVGFGCHLEARLGVQRALTELESTVRAGGAGAGSWGTPLPDESFLCAAARRGGDSTKERLSVRGGGDLRKMCSPACKGGGAGWARYAGDRSDTAGYSAVGGEGDGAGAGGTGLGSGQGGCSRCRRLGG